MPMSTLNEFQNARADALLVARNILGNKAPFGTSGLPYDEGIVDDLVDLAEYVISGRHPLEHYATKVDPEAVQITREGVVLGLVSDAPKEEEVPGHSEVKDLVSMRPGHAPGAACTCGWHSHSHTFVQHLAAVVRGES